MNEKHDNSHEDAHSLTCELLAVGLGIGYVILIGIDQFVIAKIWGGLSASVVDVQLHGARAVLALGATRSIVLLLTVLLVFATRRWALGRGFAVFKRAHLVAAAVAAPLSALVLNATGVWPFAWRWQHQANTQLVRALLDGGHGAVLTYWVLLFALGVPLIEEVVFRFGILRLVSRATHSNGLAVACSAVTFGAAHLGYPLWRPDVAHLWNAAGALGLGIILGFLVIRQRGKLTTALVVHVGVNLASAVTLLFAA